MRATHTSEQVNGGGGGESRLEKPKLTGGTAYKRENVTLRLHTTEDPGTRSRFPAQVSFFAPRDSVSLDTSNHRNSNLKIKSPHENPLFGNQRPVPSSISRPLLPPPLSPWGRKPPTMPTNRLPDPALALFSGWGGLRQGFHHHPPVLGGVAHRSTREVQQERGAGGGGLELKKKRVMTEGDVNPNPSFMFRKIWIAHKNNKSSGWFQPSQNGLAEATGGVGKKKVIRNRKLFSPHLPHSFSDLFSPLNPPRQTMLWRR